MNRKILSLAIPNIVSNITIPLLGMVDMAIVGHLGDDALIGGIGIGTSVFNFIYWNFAFLRMGTSGLTAQSYGARNFPEITAVLVRALSVSLLAAVLLILFREPVGRLAFRMMDGTPHTMGYAAEYFYARIWAAPATVSLFAFQGWFIGMQNSRFPMYVSIAINLVNILCCLWFALGLGWGIAGVAWGTVVAQYTGLLLSVALWLRYYRRFGRYVDLRDSEAPADDGFLPDQRRYFPANGLHRDRLHVLHGRFVGHGRHAAGRQYAADAAFHAVFLSDGRIRLCPGEALAGRYVGARNAPMLRLCIRALLVWGAAVAALYVGLYAAGWRSVLSLFTDSREILIGAGDYVVWLIVIPLVAFAPFLIDGVLIGATRTAVMRNSVFLSTVGFFTAYYGLRSVAGNDALWFAFLLFLILRGVFQYFMTNRLRIV